MTTVKTFFRENVYKIDVLDLMSHVYPIKSEKDLHLNWNRISRQAHLVHTI